MQESLPLLGMLGTGIWARALLLHLFRHCEFVILYKGMLSSLVNSSYFQLHPYASML